MFFRMIAAVTIVAALADRLGLLALPTWQQRAAVGLAAGLAFFGVDHLLTPDRYIPMIESFAPQPAAVVMLTGLCEIAGAIGLLIGRLRRLAGLMLAVYFVCVFPANITNALNGLAVEGLPSNDWYYWLRLPFQPLFVAWALFAGGWIGNRASPTPSAG